LSSFIYFLIIVIFPKTAFPVMYNSGVSPSVSFVSSGINIPENTGTILFIIFMLFGKTISVNPNIESTFITVFPFGRLSIIILFVPNRLKYLPPNVEFCAGPDPEIHIPAIAGICRREGNFNFFGTC